ERRKVGFVGDDEALGHGGRRGGQEQDGGPEDIAMRHKLSLLQLVPPSSTQTNAAGSVFRDEIRIANRGSAESAAIRNSRFAIRIPEPRHHSPRPRHEFEEGRRSVMRAFLAVALMASLASAQDADSCGKCGTKQYGTTVAWSGSRSEAAAKAKADEKLVFVLHVSGHFENPNFT